MSERLRRIRSPKCVPNMRFPVRAHCMFERWATLVSARRTSHTYLPERSRAISCAHANAALNERQ